MNRFEPKMRELHATLLGFESGEQPIKLTEEQIQEAERLIGARLPEDYREFVRDFGLFSLNALLSGREDERMEGGIGYFTGIVNEKRRKIFDCVSEYLDRDSQIIPDEGIKVGMDGNLFVILFFRGENKGKIYFKDYDDLWLAADSFEEFMNLLKFAFEDVEHEKLSAVESATLFWETFSTK